MGGRDNSYHRRLAEPWPEAGTIDLGSGGWIPVWPKLEEFPPELGGLSALELRDANAECAAHGRCAFDRTPPCGCHPCEKGGPVTALPQKAGKGRKAA